MTKSVSVVFGVTSVIPSPPAATNRPDHIILSKEDLFNMLSLVHILAQCTKDTLAPRDTRAGQIHNLQKSIAHLSEICEPPAQRTQDANMETT